MSYEHKQEKKTARRAERRPYPWHLHAVAAADERLATRDAERLAHLPPDGRERVLLLAAQLPGLTPEVVADLAHHVPERGFAAADRVVADLERDGLLRPLHVVGHGNTLPHSVILTEAGTAALASALGTDAATLTARYGLDDLSLGVRIGHACETLERDDMLALLGRFCEAPPLLLGWRRYWPPGSERALDPIDPVRWVLPACARLRMDGHGVAYLLLADRSEDEIAATQGKPAVRPVGFYEPVLRRILAHHATIDTPPPRLLVGTDTEERTLAWRAMLAAMDDVLPDARLGLTAATWEGLPDAFLTVTARDLLGLNVRVLHVHQEDA